MAFSLRAASLALTFVACIHKVTFDQSVQYAKDAFKALGVNTDPTIDAVARSDFPTERVGALEEDSRKMLQSENQLNKKEVKDGLTEIRSHITQLNQKIQDSIERTEKERKEDPQIPRNQLPRELRTLLFARKNVQR